MKLCKRNHIICYPINLFAEPKTFSMCLATVVRYLWILSVDSSLPGGCPCRDYEPLRANDIRAATNERCSRVLDQNWLASRSVILVTKWVFS